MDCPRCSGPALDLLHAGFNPGALEREGTCYWWGTSTYTCNQPPQSRRDRSQESFRHCFDGLAEGPAGDRPRPAVLLHAKTEEMEANLDKYLAALKRIG
jgi:hypothetical protein